MSTRIQLRRGTASEWESANPILLSGEIGMETDTRKIKIGDGSTNWNNLEYYAPAPHSSWAALAGQFFV